MARREWAAGFTMSHDRPCERRTDPRHVRQQRRRSGIHIDADLVHRRAHDSVERFLELCLVDVVLILPDLDRLGVGLDELGERILEATGDAERAANGEVEIGELRARHRARRVDRRARFVDDDLSDAGARLFESRAERRGLARGRAVADGDKLDVMGVDEVEEITLSAIDVIARRGRIHGRMSHELARGVDDDDLTSGSKARIDSENRLLVSGRGENELTEIGRKNANRLLFGDCSQRGQHFG